MRRTASRDGRNVPTTFVRRMRSSRSSSRSSSRPWVSRVPALLTSAVTVPSLASTASKSLFTSSECPTSARTTMASPPPWVISSATFVAEASSRT